MEYIDTITELCYTEGETGPGAEKKPTEKPALESDVPLSAGISAMRCFRAAYSEVMG